MALTRWMLLSLLSPTGAAAQSEAALKELLRGQDGHPQARDAGNRVLASTSTPARPSRWTTPATPSRLKDNGTAIRAGERPW